MSAHLEQSLIFHVSLLANHNHTIVTKLAEKEEQVATLTKQNMKLKQELKQNQSESEALKQEVMQLKHKQEKLELYMGVFPIEFTMTDFEQHKKDGDTWFSPPFYTHPYGYKMCLGVDANGIGSGQGTHVSIFAYLMCGKFDHSLQWPFQGCITVQLLNQLEDEKHLTRTFVSDRESICRVTIGERAGRTRGNYVFIPHTDLAHDPSMNCQYLRNNCLCFRVAKVMDVNPTIQHEVRLCVIESHNSVVPIRLIMTDFDQHRSEDYRWYSPPFYTHMCGYRMCLSVDANSYGDSKDTHIAVTGHMMQGYYDNLLKWPFLGKVTIQLLNQLEDCEHYTKTIAFTDNALSRRVTDVVRGRGWGRREFIAHTHLGHNPSKNCQYLKDDCLYFEVNEVELYMN